MAIGSAMRPNPVLWAVRVLQLLVCVSVLAFASINVNDYQSVPCSIPVRLQYNISAAAITVPIILYLLLTTGPLSRVPGWHHWAQIALDLILLGLWGAATALALPDCDDSCNACAKIGADVSTTGLFRIKTAGRLCECMSQSNGSPATRRAKRAVETTVNSVAKFAQRDLVFDDELMSIERSGTVPARLGLGGAMILLALVTLVMGTVLHFWKRDSTPRSPPPEYSPEVRQQPAAMAGVAETDFAANAVHH